MLHVLLQDKGSNKVKEIYMQDSCGHAKYSQWFKKVRFVPEHVIDMAIGATVSYPLRGRAVVACRTAVYRTNGAVVFRDNVKLRMRYR